MVNCNTVANDTQRRYGILAYDTQRKCGQVITSAQMSDPRTKIISIDARRLFFSPICKGVKAKLKTRLSAKGRATIQGNLPVKAL